MHTVTILKDLVENHQVLVYFAIFLGVIIEGEFVLISTGILLLLNALSFPLSIIVVVLGLLVKTLLGYHIGKCIYKRWNHSEFLGRMEKRVLKIMPHFKQKPFWSIFISKFILGVNNIVIVFSGYHNVNYKKYLKAELLSSLIFAPSMILLGYLFSFAALKISNEIWGFSFIVLILVVLFIVIDKVISWGYRLFEEFYHSAE